MVARAVGMTLLTSSWGALAAPGTPAPAAAAIQVARPDAVKRIAETAVESDDDAGNCTRARRRLWVEGEGWVVRRITTCR